MSIQYDTIRHFLLVFNVAMYTIIHRCFSFEMTGGESGELC